MNNNINTLLNEISYKINGDEFDKTLDILDNILKKFLKIIERICIKGRFA